MSARSIVVIMAFTSITSNASPIVYTYDFIANSNRTGFNGLEGAPVNGNYYAGSFPYTEGGVSVSQIASDPRPIWMTAGAIHAPGYPFGVTGHEGRYSWYPNGGDNGFTELTRSDGLDFYNVGFLTGNAYTSVGATYINYILLEHGITVLAGQLLVPKGSADRGYLGFGGGGFDEVRVSETSVTGGNNLFALDSIEMSANAIPEPNTILLLIAALAGLGVGSMSRKSNSPHMRSDACAAARAARGRTNENTDRIDVRHRWAVNLTRSKEA